jgi:hypothetical protein
MSEQPETTYLVKIFSRDAVTDTPFTDLLVAQDFFRSVRDDEESPAHSAYLYAITGKKRVLLNSFDRAYDEYLAWADREAYKCIYCGERSRSDDTAGFYCYAGPRGEHHYELVDGDE